jgi:NTE family protein
MRHRQIILTLLTLLFLLQGLALRAAAGDLITIRPHFDDSRGERPELIAHRQLKRPRVALVLSGGGSRGAAQIGVLRVLERYSIPVDFIAATSMGAIVGGLYASGYTVGEIEAIALETPWDDILSLTEETRRTELFVDQKISGDRSFLAVRFQGFAPVIPSAVSSGQRLTDFLSARTLQALYQPVPDFDRLKIPFRAVATDLVSGTRVVLKDGSLSEALRASATFPLLFQPIEKNGMQLVDGGLLSNIPVDVARSKGYDLVIVVNSTSSLRPPDKIFGAPWQTADQIISIMMNQANKVQLPGADVVITPNVGEHLSSDFHGLDTLIREGEAAAEQSMPSLLSLYARKLAQMQGEGDSTGTTFTGATVTFAGSPPPEPLRSSIDKDASTGVVTLRELQADVEELYALGRYRDVAADVLTDSAGTLVTFRLSEYPLLRGVHFEGNLLLPSARFTPLVAPMEGRPLDADTVRTKLEGILRLYRAAGYSLARVDTTWFDQPSGILHIHINEGVIHAIEVQGGVRSRDAFVLSEFPLHPGDIFQIDRARKGITNIASTTLFDFVYLEVSYDSGQPVITIRLQERPSQLVRIGTRADNERFLQGLLDIRDENFQGSGMDLGLTVAGGQRNVDVVMEYRARRLFNSYFTFGVGGFITTLDSYLFTDGAQTEKYHWTRDVAGEYRHIRYGVNLTFGTQLERLGNATLELILENVKVRSLDRATALEDQYRLALIRLGTIVDTKDRSPFPLSGVGLDISYEFAVDGLGSNISYNSLKVMYETFTTWGRRHTLHPRFTMGFADKTMPFAQEFRLGGLDSFFGTREDDRRGRELLLMNMEYRYFLPFKVLFDAYLRVRYDLGTISEVPEEIKFSTLRHGLGLELAFDTPIGQAAVGTGKSFFFNRDLPDNPVQQGPLLWYFVIGYQF